MNHVESHLAGDALVGEGVCWDAARERLLWVDIESRLVHVHDHGQTRTFTAPDRVGVAVPTASDDELLIAYGMQVGVLSLRDGTVTAVCEPAGDPLRVRLNDGGTDADGRFWAGSAPLEEAEDGLAALYRLGDDQRLHRVLGGLGLANGVTFGPGGHLYVADSPARRILCLAPAADGTCGDPVVFADVAALAGVPDGIAVDHDGGLWVAFWDGAAVHHFAADGGLIESLAMPVSRPTSCAFAGPRLDRLLVSSASLGLTPAQRREQPLAGGILVTAPRTHGLATTPARLPA